MNQTRFLVIIFSLCLTNDNSTCVWESGCLEYNPYSGHSLGLCGRILLKVDIFPCFWEIRCCKFSGVLYDAESKCAAKNYWYLTNFYSVAKKTFFSVGLVGKGLTQYQVRSLQITRFFVTITYASRICTFLVRKLFQKLYWTISNDFTMSFSVLRTISQYFQKKHGFWAKMCWNYFFE